MPKLLKYSAEKIDALPLGHRLKKMLDEEINQEYQKCRELEKTLSKQFKIKNHPLNVQEALEISNAICRAFLIKNIKQIHVKAIPRAKYIGAWYCKREIFSASTCVYLKTLLHELSHHVAAMDGKNSNQHGKTFLEYEELVFNCYAEIFPLKNRHSHTPENFQYRSI